MPSFLTRYNFVSRSVFVRSALLMALSTAAVAATLVVLSMNSALEIADKSVRTQAIDSTSFIAEQAGGALRYGKPEQLDTLFDKALRNANGAAMSAIAIDSEGNVVATAGEANSTELLAIAKEALAGDGDAYGETGIVVAHPVAFGNEQAIVGAVAMKWTSEFLQTQIMADQMRAVALATGIFLAALTLSMLVLRATVTRPLLSVGKAMSEVSAGEYDIEIPATARRDEIGSIANTLEQFRASLAQAEAATREGVFKGAGFENSSAALLMADTAFKIVYTNAEFRNLFDKNEAILSDARKGAASIIGSDFDVFEALSADDRAKIESGEILPYHVEVQRTDTYLSVDVNAVHSDGALIGYVIEWKDITSEHGNAAILLALETSQAKAEFDISGRLRSANAIFAGAFGKDAADLIGRDFDGVLEIEDANETSHELFRSGRSASGRFNTVGGLREGGLIEGSLTPVLNSTGQPVRYVLIGADTTEANGMIKAAERQQREMQIAQNQVVESLRQGLSRLSKGDLKSRIDEPFGQEYEQLRSDFNLAVGGLNTALKEVLDNAIAISAEAGSISGAATEMSQRTETQAATLEETVAALSQINDSLKAATDGARQADGIVNDAQAQAKASGTVVQDAVSAMDEIATSSDEISKIISVIDDIAFQTNLLALNAGVEAARAGDAGRGFAVVASEVRALAQRSSDAAREINALIATSSSHVKKGVNLVGEAGEVLKRIVNSVGDIAQHVSGIATSAEFQATSVDEINSAMQQLDRVTQESAAMFEETTAASRALNDRAEALNRTMERFEIASAPASAEVERKIVAAKAPAPTARPAAPIAAPVDGANALKVASEGWEEF